MKTKHVFAEVDSLPIIVEGKSLAEMAQVLIDYDNMHPPMMKCGHAANAKDQHGNWSCVICIGIKPGASEIDPNPPSFQGRFAHCAYGKHARVPSSPDLAFFESHPDKPEDEYYCGCRGWD